MPICWRSAGLPPSVTVSRGQSSSIPGRITCHASERQMDAVEASLREVDSIDEALQLVIEIESAEINQVFDAALAATDAVFVKKLRPFQEAMEAHMDHIVKRLPELLSPRLMLATRELRGKVSSCSNCWTLRKRTLARTRPCFSCSLASYAPSRPETDVVAAGEQRLFASLWTSAHVKRLAGSHS